MKQYLVHKDETHSWYCFIASEHIWVIMEYLIYSLKPVGTVFVVAL